jgi:hypothetical protein
MFFQKGGVNTRSVFLIETGPEAVVWPMEEYLLADIKIGGKGVRFK